MKVLSLATVFAALSGFIVMFIAPKAMSRGEVEEFMAFWGLFFAVAGLIDGLMQETTRSVSNARRMQSPPLSAAKPWPIAAAFAAMLAALSLICAPLWTPLLTGHLGLAVTLLTFGIAGYVGQALLSGLLSGTESWPAYAGLLTLDSGIRLALTVVAWKAGWGLPAFLLITVIGAFSWLIVLLVSGAGRAAARALTESTPKIFVANTLAAMAASGATALLITGFPTFIKATQDPTPQGGVTMAAVMYGVTLTRAPILVPLQRFQSALIVFFVRNQQRVLRMIVKPISAVLAVGAVGGAAAWLIGPWIMESLWGSDYRAPGLVLALLTFASACTGVLMITGTATLAIERHRAYVSGWALASVVAFGVLLLPFSLATNVCAALLAGPLSGAFVHLIALGKR